MNPTLDAVLLLLHASDVDNLATTLAAKLPRLAGPPKVLLECVEVLVLLLSLLLVVGTFEASFCVGFVQMHHRQCPVALHCLLPLTVPVLLAVWLGTLPGPRMRMSNPVAGVGFY
jgi:hypothetical protein